MDKQNPKLTNLMAERAVIACILQSGPNAFIDSEEILSTTDFYFLPYQKMFKILHDLSHVQNISSFDVASIISTASKMNLLPLSPTEDDEKFLNSMLKENVAIDNLLNFASQIFKLRIARDAWLCTRSTQKSIENIDGTEKIDDLLHLIEDPIFNFTSSISCKNDSMVSMAKDFDYTIESLAKAPKDIMGIPSGFPRWDSCVGGGLRPGSVNIIGARAKVGKSFMCLNMGYNVAKLNIPVLYLDTELSRKDQLMRLSALMSGVETNRIETGKFASNEIEKSAIEEISSSIKNLPITHCSIAGQSIKVALTIARRWLIKHVGFSESGTANPCLLIYDYIKLMDTSDVKSNMAEHQLLGFLMTDLHNFAVQWGIPILVTAQLNRDGVEKEGGHVFAGSDRILWLCTSASILKNKNDDDIANDPIDNGRQKLIVTDTRFGSGMESGDYINIKNNYATSKIIEGEMFSEIMMSNKVMINDQQ